MVSRESQAGPTVMLSGANGVVGRPLLERLEATQLSVLTVSRRAQTSAEGALQWDMNLALNESQKAQIRGCTTLIHCAPIWLLANHLAALIDLGIERLIVFSSTSVLSKVNSNNQSELLLVDKLSSSETKIKRICATSQIAYTILRPSMIYGYGRDHNVSHIARVIKRYRFMILAGRAQGLRQPVHTDDLVNAVLATLDTAASVNQTYELAGGEELSYRAMVERIFAGLGARPRIVSIPLWLMQVGLWLASKVSGFDYTADMATRMSQDLIYDIAKAKADLGYSPQPFLRNPKRDLPN